MHAENTKRRAWSKHILHDRNSCRCVFCMSLPPPRQLHRPDGRTSWRAAVMILNVSGESGGRSRRAARPGRRRLIGGGVKRARVSPSLSGSVSVRSPPTATDVSAHSPSVRPPSTQSDHHSHVLQMFFLLLACLTQPTEKTHIHSAA